MNKPIQITKRSKEIVPFSPEKLAKSIAVAGLSPEKQKHILERITPILYDGIPTEEIFDYVFQLLKGESRHTAARYKLKKALYELGPTGYPFEKYVGAVLRKMGFKTEVSVILAGKCVSHEVDVLAVQEGLSFMVECKFHSNFDRKSNVKDPLYIKARFDDIRSKWDESAQKTKLATGWLVTNTRFTEDAIAYAECESLRLLSWDYPSENAFRDIISLFKMYPITCSTTLSLKEKQQLIDRDHVLCSDIVRNVKVLNPLRISDSRKKRVIEELEAMLKDQG